MLTIGICTRERPKMLTALLESVAISIAHANAAANVKVIVVENGPPAGADAVVARFTERMQITLHHAPALGIVNARNTVVTHFLAGQDEWLAMLDDDVTVAPDWLSVFLKAMEDFPDASILAGPTVFLYHPTALRMFRARKQIPLAYGKIGQPRGGNNCFLRRKTFDDNGVQHRFDISYNFSGGEDSEFFLRCKDRGLICRHFSTARSFELVPESRQSLRFQFARWRHHAHCRGVIMIAHLGPLRGRIWVLSTILRDGLNAVIYFLGASMLIVVSERKGLNAFRLSLVSIAAFSSRPRALWQKPNTPYTKVQGH